jgi:transcription antitermination factor NusG
MQALSCWENRSAMPAGNRVDRSEAEGRAPHQWYALAVRPRHDQAVSRTLENKGFQTFVPLYKKRHRYATRFRETELPLFPGYVFCRFSPQTRLPILTTPGVIQILGAGRLPIPVDETEMESLQTALRLHLPFWPHSFLEAGQRVRISEGALTGVEGVVMTYKQCLRVVLSITLLQRSVLLELDRDYISTEGIPQ